MKQEKGKKSFRRRKLQEQIFRDSKNVQTIVCSPTCWPPNWAKLREARPEGAGVGASHCLSGLQTPSGRPQVQTVEASFWSLAFTLKAKESSSRLRREG